MRPKRKARYKRQNDFDLLLESEQLDDPKQTITTKVAAKNSIPNQKNNQLAKTHVNLEATCHTSTLGLPHQGGGDQQC